MRARLDSEVLRELEEMHRDWLRLRDGAVRKSGARLARPERPDVEPGPGHPDEEDLMHPRWLRLRGS